MGGGDTNIQSVTGRLEWGRRKRKLDDIWKQGCLSHFRILSYWKVRTTSKAKTASHSEEEGTEVQGSRVSGTRPCCQWGAWLPNAAVRKHGSSSVTTCVCAIPGKAFNFWVLDSPSVQHYSYLHSSLGQLEELHGTIHILLLAHSLACGSLSINLYCPPPPQIIYFTLSTSGPKLTIAKSYCIRSDGPSCLVIFFFFFGCLGIRVQLRTGCSFLKAIGRSPYELLTQYPNWDILPPSAYLSELLGHPSWW